MPHAHMYLIVCCAFAGMHLARNKADPEVRTRGAFGGCQMVAFTSEHAHYSYLKAAFLTGTQTGTIQQQSTCQSD